MKRALRLPLSLFIVAYILFTLQVSLFPGMKLPRLYLWPWTTWHMFQSNVEWNQTLEAVGTTASGKKAPINLDKMFEHIGAGHHPTLIFYIKELFFPLGKYDAFKNRFSQYVARQTNRVVAGEEKKIVAVDLNVLTWYKHRQNNRWKLSTKLSHRWHE